MESKNILFVGGIHGVGKGTICNRIEKFITIETVSASDLLKWSEVVKDSRSKTVQNIANT